MFNKKYTAHYQVNNYRCNFQTTSIAKQKYFHRSPAPVFTMWLGFQQKYNSLYKWPTQKPSANHQSKYYAIGNGQ